MPDADFWNRRDDWERLPRRPLAVLVALAALLLGGMAFALVPGGSGRPAAHRTAHVALAQHPANVTPPPTWQAVPIDAQLPAPELPALPVVAPSTVAPAPVLPARQPDRPATSGRGPSTSAVVAPAAPAQAQPASPAQQAPPPAPAPSCVVNALSVCVQIPSLP